MQIIEYMQKHKQYAKTYSICQKYKICKNIQNMQNLLFYRICKNMQKYAKPALFRRSQVLVTLCSFCGPTVYVQLEERGGRAGVAGFRPPPPPGASARTCITPPPPTPPPHPTARARGGGARARCWGARARGRARGWARPRSSPPPAIPS